MNWADIIYDRLRKHAEEKAIDWKPDEVEEFIEGCLDDGGIPMFKNRYAGRRFEVDGKPAVLAICYGGRGRYKDSQWFKNVPEKDIDIIEKETGEWKEFLERRTHESDISTGDNEIIVRGTCIDKRIYGIPELTKTKIMANKVIAKLLLDEHYEELKEAFEKGQKYYEIAGPIRQTAIKKVDGIVIDYDLTKKYREIEEKGDKILKDKIIELLKKHNIKEDEVKVDAIELFIVGKFTLS